MITYSCPRCHTPMVSPEGMIGDSEECPNCKAIIIVPRSHPAAPTPTREPSEFRPIMTVPRERVNPVARLGAAGAVIGVVGCLTLWVPIGFLHTAVIGGLGLAAACVGFVYARRSRGGKVAVPLLGIVLCGVSMYFSMFHSGESVKPPDPAGKPAKAPTARRAKPAPIDPTAPLPIGMARQWDDRALKVLAVKIGKVPLRSVTGDSWSADEFLMIAIEASNTSASPNRKITYRTLRGVASSRDRTFASLRNRTKRFYKRVDFGRDTYPVKGVALSAPLAPGGSVRDILIFERPADSTGPYRLDLPLGNLGGVGIASWEIPESALR